MARLLNIDHEQIRHWLCKRKIVSMRETFTKSMNVKEVRRSVGTVQCDSYNILSLFCPDNVIAKHFLSFLPRRRHVLGGVTFSMTSQPGQ